MIGRGEQVQSGRGRHDGAVPHGELEMQVEVGRDEAAGVDGPRQRGGEVAPCPFQDLHLLMVQGVFDSAAHVNIVPAHRNGLQFPAGSRHQEVLEASDHRRFRPAVGVGEVEPGGQMDSGLVLQNLERELTHGLARLQDEALVRVGPLIVRGEGRGRILQEKPASYARQQERDSKQELG